MAEITETVVIGVDGNGWIEPHTIRQSANRRSVRDARSASESSASVADSHKKFHSRHESSSETSSADARAARCDRDFRRYLAILRGVAVIRASDSEDLSCRQRRGRHGRSPICERRVSGLTRDRNRLLIASLCSIPGLRNFPATNGRRADPRPDAVSRSGSGDERDAHTACWRPTSRRRSRCTTQTAGRRS